MSEKEVTGSVEEYDLMLRSLMQAAMEFAGGAVGKQLNFEDAEGRPLGYYPPMIALGKALVGAMSYRTKLGKAGSPDMEVLAEKLWALEMLELLAPATGWRDLEPSELAEGGTD